MPRIGGAIGELQRRAGRVAEVGARPVDDAAAAILLEEDLDSLGAQSIHRGLILVGIEDECVVDAIRHLGWALLDRRRSLDQQQAYAAGVEKGDLPIRLRA